MGTLSKRPLADFGMDVKRRIERVRHDVSAKLDTLATPVAPKPRSRMTWIVASIAAAALAPALVMLGVYIGRRPRT